MSRRIAFLIYPNVQLLDAAGPIAAFEIAERLAPRSYSLRLIARNAGEVMSTSGFALAAGSLPRADSIDTLVVAGGDGSRVAAECPITLRFIRGCHAYVRRITSVCTGAYLLAAAGLLDGKPATTHWSCSADFQKRFPAVRLDADRIFIRSGKLWTSAGVTAGIDLALALIAADLGEALARRVAQQMVVYYRRPGGQSQFSSLLELESADERFAYLLDYMRANLRRPLAIADLAERASMSPRHFARAFHASTGVTPAKAVERMRAEAARAMLESGNRSIQHIADTCGFAATERMRRSFVRLFGASPAALKRRAGFGARCW